MISETNPFLAKELSKSLAQADTKSRSKAKGAHERSVEQMENTSPDSWPRGVNGQPMMKVQMSGAELIPHGQYANVSVGPAMVTAFVDQDREIEHDDEGNAKPYFSTEQRATLAQALNELAEVVEVDVIGVQRALVLEALQIQTGDK